MPSEAATEKEITDWWNDLNYEAGDFISSIEVYSYGQHYSYNASHIKTNDPEDTTKTALIETNSGFGKCFSFRDTDYVHQNFAAMVEINFTLPDKIGVYLHNDWHENIGLYINNWVTEVSIGLKVIVGHSNFKFQDCCVKIEESCVWSTPHLFL